MENVPGVHSPGSRSIAAPTGERQRTIYSLDHARSRSNLHSALAAPLSFRSRHSQPFSIITWIKAIFMEFRGPEALLNLHGRRLSGHLTDQRAMLEALLRVVGSRSAFFSSQLIDFRN